MLTEAIFLMPVSALIANAKLMVVCWSGNLQCCWEENYQDIAIRYETKTKLEAHTEYAIYIHFINTD